MIADADSADNTSISAETDDLILSMSRLSKVTRREEEEERESQEKGQSRHMLQTLLIVACMWFSSYFGGLERVPQHNMPLIARSSSSNMFQGLDTMDLVVSRYDESENSIASYIGPILNMTPLSGLTTRIIIYSTGQDESETARRLATSPSLQRGYHRQTASQCRSRRCCLFAPHHDRVAESR